MTCMLRLGVPTGVLIIGLYTKKTSQKPTGDEIRIPDVGVGGGAVHYHTPPSELLEDA